ncbi:MAG: peptidase M14, partial [Thermoanaerobaculia bacterium]
EYMDTRILDPLAEGMLAKDPKLKAEWEEKLTDPKFASDARARHRFFYRKTPYLDETVGLVPVFRLDAPLGVTAPTATAPASGGGSR